MHAIQTMPNNYPIESVEPGAVLLRRAVQSGTVIFVESGRVIIGVTDEKCEELMVHQLGFFHGPGWLEVTSAVLNLPNAVSAIAQTRVSVRRVPLPEFQANFTTCAENFKAMLIDVAKAHRQQTDLAISRLVKSAGGRCAEWFLSQTHTHAKGVCSVKFQQSKRDIAAQLGIAPETFSRVLGSMRESRLISGSGRVVNLVDLRGLRLLAGS